MRWIDGIGPNSRHGGTVRACTEGWANFLTRCLHCSTAYERSAANVRRPTHGRVGPSDTDRAIRHTGLDEPVRSPCRRIRARGRSGPIDRCGLTIGRHGPVRASVGEPGRWAVVHADLACAPRTESCDQRAWAAGRRCLRAGGAALAGGSGVRQVGATEVAQRRADRRPEGGRRAAR